MINATKQLGNLKNIEAEQCLLGAMLMKADIIADVESRVKTNDFYSTKNRVIYKAIKALNANGAKIDNIALIEFLKKMSKLDAVGGIMAIQQIEGMVYTAANYKAHIEVILKYSKRRQMLDLSEKLAQQAISLDDELSLSDVQEEIARIAVDDLGDLRTMQEEMLDFMEEFTKRKSDGYAGVQSGFTQLDRKTLGWKPSQLIILAARPSMGKTALALNFAINASMTGKSVAIFSLEMAKYDLIARMLAYMKNINLGKFLAPGEMEQRDYDRFFVGADSLSQHNLHLFDKNVASPSDIIAMCKTVQSRYGLDLVIIDYLQLLTSGGKYEGNRVQEVSYISRQLKMLAQNMSVPVIALSQLSRGVESRDDKRPRLSDLRESGSIEQDADAVMMLYRDSYYNPDTQDTTSELSLVKNRNGELGTIKLNFQGQFTKFSPAEGLYAGHDVPDSSIPY